jgi:hypothetical protein
MMLFATEVVASALVSVFVARKRVCFVAKLCFLLVPGWYRLRQSRRPAAQVRDRRPGVGRVYGTPCLCSIRRVPDSWRTRARHGRIRRRR